MASLDSSSRVRTGHLPLNNGDHMSRAMTVDVESYKLAEHFLSDDTTSGTSEHERRVQSLAEAIQDAVETWMEEEAETEMEREEAHRTDEGDLGRLTLSGGVRR